MAKKSKYALGDFKLRVGRSKTGLGLFAEEDIKKGACIIEYIGRTISKAEEYTSRSKYLFEVAKNKTIDGNIKKNTARYINHSCKPNCESDGPSGHIYIMAIKNIKAGEELTYDYGEEYFDQYFKKGGCKCEKCSRTK